MYLLSVLQIVLIVLAVIVAILVILYFIGSNLQTKQAANEKAMKQMCLMRVRPLLTNYTH